MTHKDKFKEVKQISDLPDGMNYCILEDREVSGSDGYGGSYTDKFIMILRFENEKDQKEHFEMQVLANKVLAGSKMTKAVRIEKNLKVVTEVKSV